MLLTSALVCLAANLFFESRGEPLLGRIAVANVTMNRAQHNRDNVCTEVLKPKQFSWTNTKVKSTSAGMEVRGNYIKQEQSAWAKSVIIAQLALWGALPRIVGDATFFHEAKINPYWASSFKRVRRIGNHVFYAQLADANQ